MNIFFLMHLAKIPILCFLWQTTVKSDSGYMCYYPFIQPLPCTSHSFFSFLSVSLLTDIFSWMLSLHTWCLCDKRWRVETVQFFSSRELNKLFPELWRPMNTELWFCCGKKLIPSPSFILWLEKWFLHYMQTEEENFPPTEVSPFATKFSNFKIDCCLIHFFPLRISHSQSIFKFNTW